MEITKQSSRKRQKLISGENTDEVDPVDRLSALPDDIICHVLSLLPTKHSLQTSALAKRWRVLWAHVPNLDFDCKKHESKTVSISNIINGVLLRHKSQRLNTFRLSIDYCNDYELGSWIATLIDRNVQQLYVHLQSQPVLPPRLFACKALVDLSLAYCGTIPMIDAGTQAVCLPALKKLCLDCVDYESDESLPRLLSNCPVLEELTIWRGGDYDNMICCYISSPTLKRLFLTSLCFNEEKKACKVKLDTPALRYLRFEDFVSEYISVEALTSLTEAFLDFSVVMTLAYARSVFKFISRLCNVEYLNLWTWGIEVPDSEFYVFTTKFRNLVTLEVEADWRLITKLLENADNLQVIVINMSNTNLEGWVDPKQVAACLVSRVGSVRIDHFGYSEDEFNLVRYILRNAKVLERMYIHTSRTVYFCKRADSERNEASERISLFERGSEACELFFEIEIV